MRASIRRRSIAFKVLAYVTSILAAAVLAATLATGYFTLEFARARLEERIADYAKYTAERLDSNFRSWNSFSQDGVFFAWETSLR